MQQTINDILCMIINVTLGTSYKFQHLQLEKKKEKKNREATHKFPTMAYFKKSPWVYAYKTQIYPS